MPTLFPLGPCYVLSSRLVEWFSASSKDECEDCLLEVGIENHMIGKFVEDCLRQGKSLVFDDWWQGGFWARFLKTPFYFTPIGAEGFKLLHLPLFQLRLKYASSFKSLLLPVFLRRLLNYLKGKL